MPAGSRRPVVVALAAAVVAGALQVSGTTGASAAQPGAAASGGPLTAAPENEAVTDADARAGDIAAVVLDAEGRPTIVAVTAPTVAEAKRKAAAVPGSLGVSIDMPVSIAAATPEPYRAYQWGHDALEVDALPDVDHSGSLVAVLDTGVRATHEDFASGQVLCRPGSNLVPDGAVDGCVDPHGHGTHVAGIVGASVNGKGISGVAPGTRILPVRVLNSHGAGSSQVVADGIVWAADQGADVINASLGGSSQDLALDRAVAYATAKGVLVVAAAGNNRQDADARANYPAASPGALSVASTTPTGETSAFSYRGPEVDLAAPGSDILSLGVLDDHDYVPRSGTSMATPYAAGVASMVKAAHPSYTPAQLTDALLDSALDIEAPGRDDESGAGLIHPLALLVQAPDAPLGVKASAGDASVTLDFDAVPSTPSRPVSAYAVYRDGQRVHTLTHADSSTSYSWTDDGRTNGTTYSYQVGTVGPAGESVRSPAVTATRSRCWWRRPLLTV